MHRYIITYMSHPERKKPTPGDDFVVYDDIDGYVVEASRADYIGERMSAEEATRFESLTHGAACVFEDQHFFRQY